MGVFPCRQTGVHAPRSNKRTVFSPSVAAGAGQASQALLDQVFIDGGAGQFDSAPELTFGCTSILSCLTITPYSPLNANVVLAQTATNNYLSQPDYAVGSRWRIDYDTTGNRGVFAVWSVVPEPHSALLIAFGLAGLGWRRRGLE